MMGPQIALENSFTGYYTLLLECMCSRTAVPGRWESLTYARQTARNALLMACNFIERVARFPDGVPWEPQCTTEATCEHFFGRMKSAVGTQAPSLKACLFAVQRMHFLEKQKGLPAESQRTWSGSSLSANMVVGIAKQARIAACTLFAVLSVNDTPQRVSDSLKKWWEEDGRSLLLSSTAGCPEADSETEDEQPVADEHATEGERVQQGLRILEREATLRQRLEETQSGVTAGLALSQEGPEAEQQPEAEPAAESRKAAPRTLWQILYACSSTVCAASS